MGMKADDAGLAPRLLRRQAAAAYLSVSVAFVDALRSQGILRPVQLPDARGAGAIRVPLYDRNDLDGLIERVKSGGRPDICGNGRTK